MICLLEKHNLLYEWQRDEVFKVGIDNHKLQVYFSQLLGMD